MIIYQSSVTLPAGKYPTRLSFMPIHHLLLVFFRIWTLSPVLRLKSLTYILYSHNCTFIPTKSVLAVADTPCTASYELVFEWW